MMSINADNTKDLATTCAPRGPKPYPKRRQAQDAAVADLGPHAREGFEFTTTKCDGGWMWRACDEVRPDNAAQVKANGGKKGSKLPVPPRCPHHVNTGRLAPTEAAGAQDGTGGVKVPPPAPKAPTTSLTAMAAALTARDAVDAAVEAGLTPKQFVAVAEKVADGLDLPPMFKRGSPECTVPMKSKAEQEAALKKIREAVGPDRKIKNPPSVKQAKKAAAKRGNGGTTKTAMVGELLLRKEGCITKDVLKATGWPAVSMNQQAKACGLKLRKEKVKGEPTRYFGSK